MSRVRAQAEDARVLAEKIRDNHKGRDVHITSLHVPDIGMKAGVVFNVTVEKAARCCIKQTHRLSSKAEIDQYHKQQESRRSLMASEDQRRKHGTQIVLGPDVVSALQTGQKQASAGVTAAKS